MDFLVGSLTIIATVVFFILIRKRDKEKMVNEILEESKRSGSSDESRWNAKQYLQNLQDEADRKTAQNAQNLKEHIERLDEMEMQKGHRIYRNTYKHQIAPQGVTQTVYGLFYEDTFIPSDDYFIDEEKSFNENRHAIRTELQFLLFAEGQIISPVTKGRIRKDNDEYFISDLNMCKYKGRGLGSFYLQSLSTELLRHEQIKKITGTLSTVDFKKRDKLIHFYKKNGFEVFPMTEEKNGYIEKIIRT